MTSPSKDVAQLLNDEGIAVLNQNLFIGRMPPDTENVILVLDEGGVGIQNPVWKRDNLSISIYVRGLQNDYEQGYNLAYSVKNCLNGHDTVTINGSDYIRFVINGDIVWVGFDENNRPRFSMNWTVTRENFSGDDRLDL